MNPESKWSQIWRSLVALVLTALVLPILALLAIANWSARMRGKRK